MEKNSPQGVPAGKGGFLLWGWGLSEGQERSESSLSLRQLGVCARMVGCQPCVLLSCMGP